MPLEKTAPNSMTEAEYEERVVKNWILAAKRTMQGRPMATK